MVIRGRTIFFTLLFLAVVWFIYAERAILSPFVLAAVFAYLFNPVISFVSEKTKMPRTVTILIIYGALIGLFIFATLQISAQVFEESSELHTFASHTLMNAKTQLSGLPDWARPTAYQLLTELQRSRFMNFFSAPTFFPYVSQAISRIISFFLFLFSGYYFLKDGGKMLKQMTLFVPLQFQNDVATLLQEINLILSKYLRGQVFLIILMSIVTYIALAILGVKFAATIAIFSGFAEIIPVIGPIVAGGIAALVVLLTGNVHFGLSPINAMFVVIIIYFVFRQLEDYLIIPHVMGRITKLPPFLIFAAVVAGGHIAGILGLILAVPVAAVVRLLLEFAFVRLKQK